MPCFIREKIIEAQGIKINIICHFRIGVGQHNPGHIFSWLLHPVNIIPPCSSVSSHFSRTDTINLPPWPILSASSNYWNRGPKRSRHQVFHSQTFSVNFVCLFFLFLQEFGVLGFSSLFTPSRNGSGPPDTFDIVKLINSTYELLQQQQRSAKQRTDLEEKWVLD